MAETARAGGPFREICTAADIFINCVYLSVSLSIPPFVASKSLCEPGRKLRHICDVSFDPNSERNPVPVYTKYSTFKEPTLPVQVGGDGLPLIVSSINHLPSLVAREASDEFSRLLLPSLQTLNSRTEEGLWKRAEEKYLQVVAHLPTET